MIFRPTKSKNKRDHSVFTIGDENENSEDEDDKTRGVKHDNIEALDKWKAKPDVQHCFECQAVTADSRLVAAYLLVTSEHMYCLVEIKTRRGNRNNRQTWVRMKQERLLCTVVKITSRRSMPELITFKFGDISQISESDDVTIVAADRYIIPNAGDATRMIKQLIVKADERRKEKKMAEEATETQNVEKPDDEEKRMDLNEL